MDRTWLRHPDTSGLAHLPNDAVEAWRARGWLPTDPPTDDEAHLRDPLPPEPTPEPLAEPAEATEPTTQPSPARRRQTQE